MTDSQEWGPAAAATVRAVHTAETTPQNERLVRTYHPALQAQRAVYVSESQFGPCVWLVSGPCAEVNAGGRDIHPHPADHLELMPNGRILTPRSPWKEEFLFRQGINPRKLLSNEQLDAIRELFPTAVGARVLVAGFIVILFQTLSEIRDVYKRDWVMDIGGLRVIYDIPQIEVTADSVESGMQVSEKPESIHGAGCLGLKLRLVDGTEAITTVTHGFVRNPQPHRCVQVFVDWVLGAKNAIASLRRPPQPLEIPAVAVSKGGHAYSSIGKEIWLVPVAKRVSIICYPFVSISDLCRSEQSFAASIAQARGSRTQVATFTISVSLGTRTCHQVLSSPPGWPPVSGWATYSDALSGAAVYVVRLHAVVGRWRAFEGAIASKEVRRATMVDSQYLCDRRAKSQNASLLWQTTEPSSPAEGWSGSVVCLGRPTDVSAKAIVFQNFQVQCIFEADANTGRLQTVRVKAGFLLPDEIRNSTIVTSA